MLNKLCNRQHFLSSPSVFVRFVVISASNCKLKDAFRKLKGHRMPLTKVKPSTFCFSKLKFQTYENIDHILEAEHRIANSFLVLLVSIRREIRFIMMLFTQPEIMMFKVLLKHLS